MKKYNGLFLTLLFCYMFSFTVSASSIDIDYDFRDETLQDSAEYDDISSLQDNILDYLYMDSNASTYSTESTTEIDFTNASKVFVYTPQELLPYLIVIIL